MFLYWHLRTRSLLEYILLCFSEEMEFVNVVRDILKFCIMYRWNPASQWFWQSENATVDGLSASHSSELAEESYAGVILMLLFKSQALRARWRELATYQLFASPKEQNLLIWKNDINKWQKREARFQSGLHRFYIIRSGK